MEVCICESLQVSFFFSQGLGFSYDPSTKGKSGAGNQLCCRDAACLGVAKHGGQRSAPLHTNWCFCCLTSAQLWTPARDPARCPALIDSQKSSCFCRTRHLKALYSELLSPPATPDGSRAGKRVWGSERYNPALHLSEERSP